MKLKYFLQKEKFAVSNFISVFFLITFTVIAPQTLAQDDAAQRIRQLDGK